MENIFRRLREFQAAKLNDSTSPSLSASLTPRELFKVVLDASLEVRGAVVFATFIVALVFLPVLTLTGLQGSFFAPLALSYLLAIMASLLVALTLTPALAALLFRRGVRRRQEPALQRGLKAGYVRLLGLVALRPRVVIGIVLALCVSAAACLPFFGGEFLPNFAKDILCFRSSPLPARPSPK